MDVRILGPFEIAEGSRVLRVNGVKPRAVMAMLALQVNRVVSTNHLIDGLWGDSPPENASAAAQVYISRLRKALSPYVSTPGRVNDLLRRRPPGYVLHLDPEQVDLHRFDALAREGMRVLPTAPRQAAELLADALRLWRGDALAEFAELRFAQLEIPRLHQARLDVLAARIDADLASGDHARLVGELEALAATYPLHEGLQGRLVLSLYRSGRQAQALEALRRTRRIFSEELGIEPGHDLRSLETAVLAQDPALDHRPSTSIFNGAKSGHIGWKVPARNPRFTGRDQMLGDLHDRLQGPGRNLKVEALYGMGGVGKTQLAIEYAHRYAEDYELVWWIDADQPALLPDQFVHLADAIDLPLSRSAADTVARVLAHLVQLERWLLIFDNAERPDDVAGYRPGGRGHVLVTSRFPGWGALGGRVEVDVLSRAETVSLLRGQIPRIAADVADELAEELGDLPLAAAQAAAYLEQTALPPDNYLRRFRLRRASLLARGDVLGYRGRIDTAWDLSLERLRVVSPSAVEMLEIAAFLAPEPIPVNLFADLAADLDALEDAVGAMVGFSLVRRDPDGFALHRLIQLVIRNRLSPERRVAVGARSVGLLSAAHPGDPNDPRHWARYAQLAPHALAAGSLGDTNPRCRELMLATVVYVNVRGDTRASRVIAQQLFERWQQNLGTDHPDTLTAAAHLTSALVWLAEHDQARTLGQDTLQRARRVLGPDHPVTLRLATNLTFALAWLGEGDQACALGQDSLQRAERVLGPESPDTLRLAANLAFALAWQGDAEQARALGQLSLDRSRRALGADHPITLVSAAHLALALARLGDTTADRELGEETLRRSRMALGPDHPTTLGSAAHLTFILAAAGDAERARTLGADTLDRARQRLGPDHLITLAAAAIQAAALALAGDIDQADTLSLDTLDRAGQRLGPEHLITLIAGSAQTAVLLFRGKSDAASLLGRETLRRARAQLGPDHPVTRSLITMVESDAG